MKTKSIQFIVTAFVASVPVGMILFQVFHNLKPFINQLLKA